MDFDWKVLAPATVFVNATAISAAFAVGASIYCKVPVIIILFANATVVIPAMRSQNENTNNHALISYAQFLRKNLLGFLYY